jgi:two-component system, chemotaxis family, chemotaxis protein CheY
MIDLNDKLAQEYLIECMDHLDTMKSDLCGLEKGEAENHEERFDRLFRAANLIREGALFFNLVKVRELAQHTEEALELIRDGRILLTPGRTRLLLGAADRLRELVRHPGESNRANISDIVAAVAGLCLSDRISPKSRPVERAERDAHLRTLLVEDDFTSRRILHTFLSRYGECHIALNGKEAVEAFRSSSERGEKYDLICMDIMMPEMDGREAVGHVRRIEESHGVLSTRGAKIIMTTTVRDVKAVIRSFMELCDAYLMKPIDLAQLHGLMKSYRLIP